jgi:low temperature requirement protein LtrA
LVDISISSFGVLLFRSSGNSYSSVLVPLRRSTVLRDRGGERVAHVTNMELFFDLVYVYAITQLSEHLYDDLTLRGGLQTAVVFLAVWWAWNYTAWATNWIDPGRLPVVALIAVLMAISLVMSSAIPEAFAGRGLPFAIAYVALQAIRSGFMVWAFGLRRKMGRNYAQLLAWSAIAGAVWIAGGLVHDQDTRLAVWAVAIVLDLAAPMHGFRLPGVAGTPIGDWTLAGGHLAERCQLVLMIAFGESVLRVGQTFARAHGNPRVDTTFVIGFGLTLFLWAIYFLRHAEHGAETIESSPDDAARIGRSGYAYAHALMVGGVIVVAVAIRLAIERPVASASTGFAAVCLGGPALYVAGVTLFKRALGHGRLWPPLLGVLAFAVLGAAATVVGERLTVLIVAMVVAAILAVASVLEHDAASA